MRKLLTLTLAVLLVGLFAAVVFAAVESGDGSSSTTFGTTDTTDTTETTETTGTTETTTTPGDISGPCDEAENRNDPRCAGVAVPPAQGAAPAPVAPQGGVDISGPCDEPEHFNDPRCTGVGDNHRGGGDDSSGPGPGGDDSGHGAATSTAPALAAATSTTPATAATTSTTPATVAATTPVAAAGAVAAETTTEPARAVHPRPAGKRVGGGPARFAASTPQPPPSI